MPIPPFRGAVRPQKPSDLSLGEFIALLRICRGHTQADLARLLRTKQANIARMESRAYTAYSLETLARVFDVLGTKLEIHPVSQEAA